MARFCAGVLLVLFGACLLYAQTAATPLSDPQATAIAQQSIAALTGGQPVSDISLGANVTWLAGSDDVTGTGSLQAKGPSESRLDLSLGDSSRTEIRALSDGFPTGTWATGGATPQPIAIHNSWTDAAWFFPALSSLGQSTNPDFVFSYIGQEQHGSVNTQHIRAYQILPQDTKNLFQVPRLSTTDIYLDSSSFLPVAITFKVHPDNDMKTDIPTEVRLANYQLVNGFQIR